MFTILGKASIETKELAIPLTVPDSVHDVFECENGKFHPYSRTGNPAECVIE